ncbi:hypothetical protein UFOVP723_164 [uncultured Caudovirales phage]|uniref:Uncharacterized protein n=1 Tax=uncultured Caudovirales phage TaxID=2100421 RepID=A0A6J5NSW2_9CAUD|nr:hypothetical protein UFOVP723_164 [uncultured Caudovirales phage]
MGILSNNYAQIVPGALISASYVSDIYDVLMGVEVENVMLSGSLNVTGSIIGTLTGTASFATSASRAISASYVDSASYSISASYVQSSSYSISSSYSLYAVSASYEINYETSSSYAETSSISLSSSFASTSSYSINAISSSYAVSTSYSTTAQTASYVVNSISASYVTGSEIHVISGSANYVNVSDTFIVQGTILLYTASLLETDPLIIGQLWRSGSYLMISTGSGI